VHADLTTAAGVNRFMNEITRVSDRLDVLVANMGSAGTPEEDNLLDLTPALFQTLVDANLKAPLLTAQAAMKRFMLPQRSGIIIFLGTHNGQMGRANMGPMVYGAAKAALTSVMANLVAQFGRHIRVNLCRPGITVTESKNWTRRRDTNPDWERLESQMSANGRLAKPSDVAEAIAWLASDKARHVNGIELPVDGGLAAAGICHPSWSPADFRRSFVESVMTEETQKKRKVA
jgi:3-oxoacyl-[acyl-carrier protein] reductase